MDGIYPYLFGFIFGFPAGIVFCIFWRLAKEGTVIIYIDDLPLGFDFWKRKDKENEQQ